MMKAANCVMLLLRKDLILMRTSNLIFTVSCQVYIQQLINVLSKVKVLDADALMKIIKIDARLGVCKTGHHATTFSMTSNMASVMGRK